MSLICSNDFVKQNLIVNIDISNINSWNLNTGLTVNSINKWFDAKSDNNILYDWGLTNFDIGKTNKMWDNYILTPQDLFLSLSPVGYNIISNPTTTEYTGVTINTERLPISGITSGSTGNYFELDGGYLNGYFKLYNYNYQTLPSRYNDGFTIESLMYLYDDSEGIFLLMGVRSEDKYNPFFSGETTTGNTDNLNVYTSEDNYLDAIKETQELKNAFGDYENRFKETLSQSSQINNISNNIISFEIINNKLAYKYIDGSGVLRFNQSFNDTSKYTGWTIISISYKPYVVFDDQELLECSTQQRLGDLRFFVNGSLFWKITDFPEIYFNEINNDKEKQIGVPYTINWGGGSFGLKHAWHYDLQQYDLYNNNNTSYIVNNFTVESNPIPEKCDVISGGTILDGLNLSANTSTFTRVDDCNPNIEYPITAMTINYDNTSTGLTANTYFVKFNNPITVLSNRDYVINMDLFNDDFFYVYDDNNYTVQNKISLIVYGTEDINIIDEYNYYYPVNYEASYNNIPKNKERGEIYPLEYQYVKDGISYYGKTGLIVNEENWYYNNISKDKIIYQDNKWININTKFSLKENTGKQTIYIGFLIETSYKFNPNGRLFVMDLNYKGADVLSQNPNHDNLLIEQNFDSSIKTKLQKLRIYNKALSNQEILHNANIEKNNNPDLKITKGGRLIYK